jgi:hypothetical protein
LPCDLAADPERVRFLLGARLEREAWKLFADCGVTDATLTTNGLGNGHVKVHEESVSSHAYVFIEDGPAGQFYVTEPYSH